MTTTTISAHAELPAGRRPPTARRPRRRVSIFQLLMIVAGVTWLIPILWMIVLSVSSNKALQLGAQTVIPKDFTLSNILREIEDARVLRWILNSVVVTGITTVGTVAVSAMAGYAFGRLNFRFKDPLFLLTLGLLMIPREAIFIPLYLGFNQAGLLNTYPGLFLPRIALPLGVFLMTQFFRAVPVEMEEAATLDGAGHFRIFSGIMLPLARPAMAALAIFAFVQSWNDYLWPLVVATDPNFFTLTVGLASQQVALAQATNLGDLMARGLIGSLPLLIVFLVFQRQLIRGIALANGDK